MAACSQKHGLHSKIAVISVRPSLLKAGPQEAPAMICMLLTGAQGSKSAMRGSMYQHPFSSILGEFYHFFSSITTQVVPEWADLYACLPAYLPTHSIPAARRVTRKIGKEETQGINTSEEQVQSEHRLMYSGRVRAQTAARRYHGFRGRFRNSILKT